MWNTLLKTGKILSLAAMALVLARCDVEEPDFSNLRDFKLLKMDGKRVEAEFTVDCENPNAFGFKVKKSALNVSVDNQVFGVISLDKKIKIRRKSNTAYTVPVVIDLENGAMLRLIKYVGRKDLEVTIAGKVKGSVCGISKSFNVNETRKVDGSLFNLNSAE